MHKKNYTFVIFLISLLLAITISNLPKSNQTTNSQISLKPKIAENMIFNVTLLVTAPIGYSMPGSTPIVINLSVIASSLPPSADPFGITTPEDPDDIKWDATYVTYEDVLIPSQVDDVDEVSGYSENDELLFALPESVSLAGGQRTSFTIYLSQKDLNLPSAYFPDVCSLTVYPKLQELDELYPEFIDPDNGAYYIDNEIVRGAVLVSAAWSSGSVYEISLLDNQGESRFDIIKEKFPFPSEIWKWSRFARIEEFTSQNQYATRPYPGKVINMISGPIRARISVQSTQPYIKGVFGGSTTQLDVFGVFTYDVYVNQPYFDYSLDITGPDAGNYPELTIEYDNREWGGGRPGTYYKGIYVPGYAGDAGLATGWAMRSPDDTNIHTINADDFTSPWYLEALLEGTTITPPQWAEENDDQLGYGFIFDPTGFDNMTWSASSEGVENLYYSAQFPLHTRYHPFDVEILQGQDKIAFMEDKYDEYLRPAPTLSFNCSIISVTDLPFNNLFVSKPEVNLDFDNGLLQVKNITAFATDVAEFVTDTTATSATYLMLYFENNSETGIAGSLTWNSISQTWETTNLDVSALNLYNSYIIVVEIKTSTLGGSSPPSERITGGVDIYPPIIACISQTPMETQSIRLTDIVKVGCCVTDYSGVSSVILRYSNGSWYDVPMVFENGLFTGSIPPQPPGTTVQYQITATDNSDRENYNTTQIFSYSVQTEYTSTTEGSKITPGFTILIVLVLLSVSLFKKRRVSSKDYY